MKAYRVVATINRPTGGGRSITAGLPTFYLDADFLGIVSDQHAERIARAMIHTINPDARVSVYAEKAEEN